MNLNEKIIELRKKNGYSQEMLADRIGVSRQAVSKWELGDSVPDTDKLIALSDLFEVSLDELIGKENVTKVQSEQNVSLTIKMSAPMIIVATVALIACLALGYFIGVKNGEAIANDRIPNNFCVYSYQVERGSSNEKLSTITINADVSEYRENLKYQMIIRNLAKNKGDIVEAVYKEGLISCQYTFENDAQYAISLMVSSKNATVSFPVVKTIVFTQFGWHEE